MRNNAQTFCCKLVRVEDGEYDQWTKQNIRLPVKNHTRHGSRGNWTLSFQTFRFFVISSVPVWTVVSKFAKQRFSEILAVVHSGIVVEIRFDPFVLVSHYLAPCATAASL